MTNNTDIAWAAGLFEGEGCFYLSNPKGPDGRRRLRCGMTITMSDRDVLERFQATVGAGNLAKLGWTRSARHKELWKWQVQKRAEIERIGNLLHPWLGERRRAKLAQVLAARTKNEPRRCTYCGVEFVPRRARKERAFCTRTCAARAQMNVKNPRYGRSPIQEASNG